MGSTSLYKLRHAETRPYHTGDTLFQGRRYYFISRLNYIVQFYLPGYFYGGYLFSLHATPTPALKETASTKKTIDAHGSPSASCLLIEIFTVSRLMHSRSFKVIRFGVNEESLRGYIVQYNNCGLVCEGSADTSSERSENRHLRLPHSHLTLPF